MQNETHQTSNHQAKAMQNQSLTWKKTTLQLFAALSRDISNKDVADATGLSATWITEFTKGKIKEPSVDKVETLHNYLKSITAK